MPIFRFISGRRRIRVAFSLVELLVVMAVIIVMLVILLTIISKTFKVVKSFRSDSGDPTKTQFRQLQ